MTTSTMSVSTRARYPWHEWADGGVHGVAVTSSDGETETEVMRKIDRLRNSVYMRGKRHNLTVRTRLDYEDERVTLRFQMLPEGREDEFSEIFERGTFEDFEVLALDEKGELVSERA